MFGQLLTMHSHEYGIQTSLLTFSHIIVHIPLNNNITMTKLQPANTHHITHCATRTPLHQPNISSFHPARAQPAPHRHGRLPSLPSIIPSSKRRLVDNRRREVTDLRRRVTVARRPTGRSFAIEFSQFVDVYDNSFSARRPSNDEVNIIQDAFDAISSYVVTGPFRGSSSTSSRIVVPDEFMTPIGLRFYIGIVIPLHSFRFPPLCCATNRNAV